MPWNIDPTKTASTLDPGKTASPVLPDSLMDNFEDEPDGIYGDVTLSDHWSGDLGSASRSTNRAFAGNKSLALTTTGNARQLLTEGPLGVTPQQDIPWICDFFAIRRFCTFYYGLDTLDRNTASGYSVLFQTQNDEFSLLRVDDGSSTTLASYTGSDIQEDSHYIIAFDWTSSGDHTVDLYDSSYNKVTTLAVTDANYNDSTSNWGVFANQRNSDADKTLHLDAVREGTINV